MEELKQINLKDLSIRCKSKKELYDYELYLQTPNTLEKLLLAKLR